LTDYIKKLLGLAETFHRWTAALSGLDRLRRRRVAVFAERIAATMARAADALVRLQEKPADGAALRQALREFGRISGYLELIVHALEHHLDGRKLAGVKRRLERLEVGEIEASGVLKGAPARIERLAMAEGYFRALADSLRT
jgi:hypothetical protein